MGATGVRLTKTNPNAGRKPGGMNKLTADTKHVIKGFVDDKYEEVVQAWGRLEDVDKVKTWISLIKFVAPTMSAIKVEDSKGDDLVQKILDSQK